MATFLGLAFLALGVLAAGVSVYLLVRREQDDGEPDGEPEKWLRDLFLLMI